MGALKLQQQRAGTIRRVVRVAGHFVCGLCRNPYADMRVARDCLEQCWEDTLAMDPVVVKKYHGQKAHRCRFCARDFSERSGAHQCAEECKSKLKRKMFAEAKLGGIEDQPQSRRKFTRKMLVQAVMPIVAAKKKQKNRPDIAPLIRTQADILPMVAKKSIPVPVNNQEPVVDQSVEAGAAPKRVKPSDIFYRDQAKYVCTVCHEKFFTKVEVTNCWEAHE